MNKVQAPAERGQAADAKGTRRIADRPRRSIPIGWIVGGLIAALVVIAVVFGGGGITESGDPAVTGAPLPLYSAGGLDGAVGLQAPTITGADFDGDQVTIGAVGQPVAIAFLAHWCPHCQAEVIEVHDWLDAGGGVDGVEIVSVATATNSARDNYPPSVWLSEWTPSVLLDDLDGSAMAAYGGNAFPFWVFLDDTGRVVSRSAGSLDLTTLVQMMEATTG